MTESLLVVWLHLVVKEGCLCLIVRWRVRFTITGVKYIYNIWSFSRKWYSTLTSHIKLLSVLDFYFTASSSLQKIILQWTDVSRWVLVLVRLVWADIKYKVSTGEWVNLIRTTSEGNWSLVKTDVWQGRESWLHHYSAESPIPLTGTRNHPHQYLLLNITT